MMRAGALSSSSPISRFVSRNGPRTLVANVSSMPSTKRPLAQQHAGVVDQHVEPRRLGAEARREPPYRLEAAEVAKLT